MTWERPATIYYIATRDRSMVKIGISSVPADRLSVLMAWSPQPLDIIAVAPGSYKEETAAHNAFATQHSHGEWFHGCPEILAAAEAISRTGTIPEYLLPKAGQTKPAFKRRYRTVEQRAKLSASLLYWADRRKAYQASRAVSA